MLNESETKYDGEEQFLKAVLLPNANELIYLLHAKCPLQKN